MRDGELTGITRGSKTVLADLGMEDAEELSTKMRLAVEILRIVRGRGLRQADVARRLGIPKAPVHETRGSRCSGRAGEPSVGQ